MENKTFFLFLVLSLYSCKNDRVISRTNCFECQSKNAIGDIDLNAINEPCFDKINTCQDYFRIMVIPPFDSIKVFTINKESNVYAITAKTVGRSQLIDNTHPKNIMSYNEKKMPILTQQVDTFVFLLDKIKFWEISESDSLEWIDPVFIVCDINLKNRFKRVTRQNFVDQNIELLHNYIAAIVAKQ